MTPTPNTSDITLGEQIQEIVYNVIDMGLEEDDAVKQLLNLFKQYGEEVIGDVEYRETEDMSLSSWTDEDKKAFARNELIIEQRQRLDNMVIS